MGQNLLSGEHVSHSVGLLCIIAQASTCFYLIYHDAAITSVATNTFMHLGSMSTCPLFFAESKSSVNVMNTVVAIAFRTLWAVLSVANLTGGDAVKTVLKPREVRVIVAALQAAVAEGPFDIGGP